MSNVVVVLTTGLLIKLLVALMRPVALLASLHAAPLSDSVTRSSVPTVVALLVPHLSNAPPSSTDVAASWA